MSEKYCPIRKLLTMLSTMVKEKNYSCAGLAAKATKNGKPITAYQVRSVANAPFRESKVVSTMDGYIDTVLKTCQITDDELLKRTVEHITQCEIRKVASSMSWLTEQERAFVLDPSNKKYISYAL